MTFQSRFGRAKWLEPYTEPTLRELRRGRGTSRVDVMCPGFPADCLETLEEIAMEGRDAFLQSGGKEFNYIPCLNDSSPRLDHGAQRRHRRAAPAAGWPTPRRALRSVPR